MPSSLLNRLMLAQPIQSPVLHLTLGAWQAAATSAPAPEPPTDAPAPEASDEDEELLEEPEAEHEEYFNGDDSAVGQVLRRASHELEQTAERGVRASSPTVEDHLRSLAERMRQPGVDRLRQRAHQGINNDTAC